MARPRLLSLLSRPWVRRLSGSCCPLRENRGLLRVRGPNTPAFLQGLITNDAERLGEGAVYAHLLNVQGRSLFDVILYRLPTDGQSDLLLECDIQALEPIQKHLQVYNFRKKVEVSPCPELSVWAVLPGQKQQDPPGKRLPSPVVVCSPDPRVPVMGWRIVAQADGDIAGLLPEAQLGNYEEYCKYRYQHGVPEGVKDLPPGVALPLESNLVYMNGISFSKGCYLGQELTARTHHTGVIRKRLVPVQLSSPLSPECEQSEVVTASGKAAGKYRAGVGDSGLALLRLEHLGVELQIKVGGREPVGVKASAPEWWPKPGTSS
ncbi:PREDICTED: putative transferase CAF17, mitochondrial [Nanorana parkeri]|uniref:putative transferase CAF17, mitochondrial n=1 Tax=Nanorana parkeri TaxID=125878 RepID=UPI000854F2D3|nr:PREDICTED: putative transferase CAF17, mitochondrial [Nanorana parkeri]